MSDPIQAAQQKAAQAAAQATQAVTETTARVAQTVGQATQAANQATARVTGAANAAINRANQATVKAAAAANQAAAAAAASAMAAVEKLKGSLPGPLANKINDIPLDKDPVIAYKQLQALIEEEKIKVAEILMMDNETLLKEGKKKIKELGAQEIAKRVKIDPKLKALATGAVTFAIGIYPFDARIAAAKLYFAARKKLEDKRKQFSKDKLKAMASKLDFPIKPTDVAQAISNPPQIPQLPFKDN